MKTKITTMTLYVLMVCFGFTTPSYADDADHQKRLSEHFRIEKPEGKGPFPAVILVSGCSRFDAEFSEKHYNRVQIQFDVPELPEKMEYRFGTLGYNETAAKNAWKEVMGFLQK